MAQVISLGHCRSPLELAVSHSPPHQPTSRFRAVAAAACLFSSSSLSSSAGGGGLYGSSPRPVESSYSVHGVCQASSPAAAAPRRWQASGIRSRVQFVRLRLHRLTPHAQFDKRRRTLLRVSVAPIIHEWRRNPGRGRRGGAVPFTRARADVAAAAATAERGHREGVEEEISSSSRRRRNWGEGEISVNSYPSDSDTGEDGRQRWTQSVVVAESSTAYPPVANTSDLAFIRQDAGILCGVLVGAFIWVRCFDFFTSKNILGQKLSRKLVHITSGLMYMLTWPLFSTSKWAPFIAGLVPLANGIRLLLYGFGILKNEGLVHSMSRSGEPRELLRGPLYYVLVLFASTMLFWRKSPVGVSALSMMCGGDGIADIMGRKFGSKKLPYNNEKSFAGSISMFFFGFLVSAVFVSYFTAFGFFELDPYSAAVRLAVISLVATVVESLPITKRLDDNFTVPATAIFLGVLLFPLK